MITLRDRETFFGQRPSHPAKPDWLIRAEVGAAQAWRDYDLAGERIYFDGRLTDITQAEYDHIERLWGIAHRAATRLEYCMSCWGSGREPEMEAIAVVDWQRGARVAQEV